MDPALRSLEGVQDTGMARQLLLQRHPEPVSLEVNPMVFHSGTWAYFLGLSRGLLPYTCA